MRSLWQKSNSNLDVYGSILQFSGGSRSSRTSHRSLGVLHLNQGWSYSFKAFTPSLPVPPPFLDRLVAAAALNQAPQRGTEGSQTSSELSLCSALVLQVKPAAGREYSESLRAHQKETTSPLTDRKGLMCWNNLISREVKPLLGWFGSPEVSVKVSHQGFLQTYCHTCQCDLKQRFQGRHLKSSCQNILTCATWAVL